MSHISLQEYRYKIAEQIENGQIDEAIAHCRHILAHYPRYLSVYKLLAHACLEKGDFSHANHFFQCVLSADLEDADAWINLALLTEDLGQTQQAIWLLERAFEVAPGNTRVRELLRQLYAQRDGAERTRIKLTPTALARLYAQGGFYHRAIRELEKMLHESATLPRLQIATLEVSLAEALWNARDMASLADQVCRSLLDKVPLSLQANLILGGIRADDGRHQEAESFLQIARTLDPEGELAHDLLGHRSPLSLQEVSIPYLEYEAAPVKEAQAVEPEREDTSWLDRIGESMGPFGLEEEPQVPEWIKSWPDNEVLVPTTADQESAELDRPETELKSTLSTRELRQDAERVPDWLLEVQQQSVAPDADQDLPDWLRDLPEGAKGERTLAPEEQPPDWLQALDVQEPIETSPQAEETPTLQGDLPDWLLELSQTEALETSAELSTAEDELADWSQEQETVVPPDRVQPEKTTRPLRAPTPLHDAAQPEEETELPEWFDELRQEAETAEPGEPEKETAFMPAAPPTRDEVPDWLRALSDEGETETPETPVTEPVATAAADTVSRARPGEPLAEIAAEDLPNWLRELEAEISGVEILDATVRPLAAEAPAGPPPVTPSEPLEAVAPAAEALPEAEQLDWLATPADQVPPEETSEALLEPELQHAIPDWLEELEPEPEAESAEIPEAVLEPTPDDELPDWLQELRAESEFAEALAPIDQEVEEFAPVEEIDLEPMSEEELPDWLQQLRPTGEPAPERAQEPEPVLPSAQAEPQAEWIGEAAEISGELEDMDWLRELEEAPTIAEAPAKPEQAAPILPVIEAAEQKQAEEPEVARVEPPAREAPVSEAQDAETRLARARARMSESALDESAQEYERLVQEPDLAGELIGELEEAVQTHPNHHALQRVLGDAYMRTGKLQKALEAYRQALKKL